MILPRVCGTSPVGDVEGGTPPPVGGAPEGGEAGGPAGGVAGDGFCGGLLAALLGDGASLALPPHPVLFLTQLLSLLKDSRVQLPALPKTSRTLLISSGKPLHLAAALVSDGKI